MASQVIVPKLTNEMQEGRILEWLCSEGDVVSVGQPLFVVETDKAAIEVPSEQSGTILKILTPTGDTVPIGAPVAWIGTPGEAIPEPERAATTHELVGQMEAIPTSPPSVIADAIDLDETKATDKAERVLASPIAKRLAYELGLNLKDVQEHTGRRRLTEADVRSYAEVQATTKSVTSVDEKIPILPDVEFTLVKPSPLQRTMAVRMTESAAIPQFAAACDVQLASLERFRSELLSNWEETYGFHLTYTHILAALVSQALGSHPSLNASWTPDGLRLYRVVNLGVAMATERGLVVPVLRGADQLSLVEIATEIVRLRQAAERNRLLPQDLTGGTFTLNNVGMMGITLSIPLLNPPQSGILAVAAKRVQVTIENDKLKSIPVTTITLAADHRIVDGAASATFLGRVKELVEDPWLTLPDRKGRGSVKKKD